MSARKPNPILENISFFDITHDGKAVGKHEEMIVFAEHAVPGDIADIQVYKKKKSFYEGKAITFHQQSTLREKPFCSHFGICGGCKWQHLAYKAQLDFKHKQVSDSLERLAKIDSQTIVPILAAEDTRYYRNKLEFTFSNKRWLDRADMGNGLEQQDMDALGFHVPGRFDKIVSVDTCYLQDDLSNKIRNYVGAFVKKHQLAFYDLKAHTGFLRNLIIRNTTIGEWMVVMVFATENQENIRLVMEALQTEFPQINALLYIVNTKKNDTIFDQTIHIWKGRDHIFEEFTTSKGKTIRYKIGPKSFFQTNSKQAIALYKLTHDYAGLTGNELVYDLYTGAGTIANFVAGDARKVIGVEYVPEAIEDAKENAKINNIDNTLFFAGDMKDLLNDEFCQLHGKPDVVITDPPRAGMHADVVATLLRLAAPKIVYVSCNPATQARDIQLLADKYEVVKVQPVDMFPHTQHVENIALLVLKTE